MYRPYFLHALTYGQGQTNVKHEQTIIFHKKHDSHHNAENVMDRR